MTIRLTPLTDPDFRPFSRRIAWLAADGDGNPVGSAFLRLDSRKSHSHLAELELNVHPAERRRGIGSQLLGAVVAAARDHEVPTVLADARVDSPASPNSSYRGTGRATRSITAPPSFPAIAVTAWRCG